jgi:hypothetical protein
VDRITDLLSAMLLVIPLGTAPAQQYHASELPSACGKFPKLVPYSVWLQVDDNGRIVWNVERKGKIILEPVDAKDLGPGLKRRKATAEKTSNFVIGFSGSYKDAARKKFLAEILKRSGLAFSPPECNPPVP